MFRQVDALIIRFFQNLITFLDHECGFVRKRILKTFYIIAIFFYLFSCFYLVVDVIGMFSHKGDQYYYLTFIMCQGLLLMPLFLTVELFVNHRYKEHAEAVIRTRLFRRYSWILLVLLMTYLIGSRQEVVVAVKEFFQRPEGIVATVCSVLCYVTEYVACTQTPLPKNISAKHSFAS